MWGKSGCGLTKVSGLVLLLRSSKHYVYALQTFIQYSTIWHIYQYLVGHPSASIIFQGTVKTFSLTLGIFFHLIISNIWSTQSVKMEIWMGKGASILREDDGGLLLAFSFIWFLSNISLTACPQSAKMETWMEKKNFNLHLCVVRWQVIIGWHHTTGFWTTLKCSNHQYW